MGAAVRGVPFGCYCSGSIRARDEGICELKKLEAAEETRDKSDNSSAVTLDDIILAGLERGLTMSDIRRMQLGQVVDFVIAYNERQEEAEKAQKRAEKRATKRKGTQNDINAFFG